MYPACLHQRLFINSFILPHNRWLPLCPALSKMATSKLPEFSALPKMAAYESSKLPVSSKMATTRLPVLPVPVRMHDQPVPPWLPEAYSTQ